MSSTTVASPVEAQIAFADAALGMAGHDLSDPVLRDILRQVVAGQITREQGAELARRHVEAR
ncbi:MAG: hypothetical protein FWF02_13890 [Micrococcales bacterium]|nr:hypothetical protein [Micrococcales bacterium]MCL2668769.1 hypothetical protein [Micrococcales bacterium]